MAVSSKTLERLAAYSDAIMAVVATLLVLGIAVPEDHQFSKDGLLSFLAKTRHDLGAYALSFLIITGYWLQHHAIFLFMHHANRAFTWLNFAFLFCVTLIPFVTKLMSLYRQEEFVVLIYGVVQVACGTLLGLMWWYATRHPQLLTAAIDPGTVRSLTVRIWAGPAINLAAVGAALVSVPVAVVMFLSVPLLNLSHRRVDASLGEIEAVTPEKTGPRKND